MSIGEMRHQITIQTQSLSNDGYGGKTRSWSDLDTVWASLDPVSASERFFAGKEEMAVTHKIGIRYRSDIDSTMRCLFGSRVFLITAIRNIDELNRFQELLTREETV